MNASLPTNGSATILKASAQNGSLGSEWRTSSASVRGLMPVTGGTSSGDGR